MNKNNLRTRHGGSDISLPPELRSDARTHLARRAIYVVTFVFAAVLAWASFAPVEEVAVAKGQIVPADSVTEVQHLEGGLVEQVLVSEGDRVSAGQTLIDLRPEGAGSDLGQLEAREANLRMKRIRLSALIDDREPDFGALADQYPEMAQEHSSAYREAAAEARSERRQVELTIKRLSEQIENARTEAASMRRQMALQKDQTAIREESAEKGYTSRYMLLQSRASMEETRQRLSAVEGRIAEHINQREEARAKLTGLRAEQRSKWANARSETIAQLSEVRETLKKYRDRVARLAVTSPVDGLIQSLQYKIAGEVIKPGALVAEIVPEHGGLLAEVELQPSDIGHVRNGNEAEITLSNYDPNVVGILHGKVREISPTTVEDKEGRYFYRVRIALARESLGQDGERVPLLPGMTLQAKIRTGSKTLARYMLKPVLQSFDTAFAER
jgi:membrane fusion protein, adhesin transport system